MNKYNSNAAFVDPSVIGINSSYPTISNVLSSGIVLGTQVQESKVYIKNAEIENYYSKEQVDDLLENMQKRLIKALHLPENFFVYDDEYIE